jgi:hypothetical protein
LSRKKQTEPLCVADKVHGRFGGFAVSRSYGRRNLDSLADGVPAPQLGLRATLQDLPDLLLAKRLPGERPQPKTRGAR